MGLFSSRKSKSTSITTTNISDDRVGATDQSVVANDGSVLNIERVEDDIVRDSLSQLLGFAGKQQKATSDILREGLDLVDGANQQTGELVKEVLSKSRSEGGETLKDVNRTVMFVGLAFAAAFAFKGVR